MKLHLFIFFILSFNLASSLQATDTRPLVESSTPYGYNGQDQFCSNGAKDKFQELDNITHINVQSINEKIKKINELKAKKILIADLLSVKNTFTQAALALRKDFKKKEEADKKSKLETINQFKTLIQTSLTLSAVNLLAKDTNNQKNHLWIIAKARVLIYAHLSTLLSKQAHLSLSIKHSTMLKRHF